MNIGFDGLLDWAKEEGGNLILVAAIFFAVLLAFKRQFIGAIGTFLVLLITYLIVTKPELIGKVAEFAAKLVGVN
ncbi:hypothetical protein BS614_30850 (plasmid) [Paenibacillus xylanexedens]|uniref:hypothetical protein n=1 Tax=Paenibacillus xylanexedens TaxID=528191 RepID=UPI0009386E05|nr:hypothetical protein [Paenibacillus xylanexedens]APO48522.1 hypothetical protein BS614_30850 [Paenibacillus xylanexedens]